MIDCCVLYSPGIGNCPQLSYMLYIVERPIPPLSMFEKVIDLF